ncbi:MAG: hypothetical protein QM586_04365 [Xenophilus sp.]
MKRLLDTHALLWWWTDDPQLPASACAAIQNPRHSVLVSAASAWEIGTKHLGTLELAAQALPRLDELWGAAMALNTCPCGTTMPCAPAATRRIIATLSTACWSPKAPSKTPRWSPKTPPSPSSVRARSGRQPRLARTAMSSAWGNAMHSKSNASARSLGSDLAKVDAHQVGAAEYDELTELTEAMLKRATVNRGGRPKSDAPKVLLSVRYSPNIMAFFRSTGNWLAVADGRRRSLVRPEQFRSQPLAGR